MIPYLSGSALTRLVEEQSTHSHTVRSSASCTVTGGVDCHTTLSQCQIIKIGDKNKT